MNDDIIGLSAVEITKLFMVPVSTAARKDGESGSAIDLRGDSLIHCTWNVEFFWIRMYMNDTKPAQVCLGNSFWDLYICTKVAFTKRCTVDPQNSSLIPASGGRLTARGLGRSWTKQTTCSGVGSKIDTKRLAVSLPPLAGEFFQFNITVVGKEIPDLSTQQKGTESILVKFESLLFVDLCYRFWFYFSSC